MKRRNRLAFFVVLGALSAGAGVEGCSNGSGGSGGNAGNGGHGGNGTGCPADMGAYAPPTGSCSKEGYQCPYGDTSCVTVYVCTKGAWVPGGCETTSATTGSGPGDAGGD